MRHDLIEEHNTSSNPTFDCILSARLSRRGMLGGAASAAALTAIGVGMTADAGAADGAARAAKRSLGLNFNPVAKGLEDAVILPPGYSYKVLYALGDPIHARISDYANDGSDEYWTFAYRSGDHHDGMHFFGMGGNGRWDRNAASRGLLCLNHEAITPAYLHPAGQTIVNGVRTVPEEVKREFYVHGVSIIELGRRASKFGRAGEWAYDRSSRFNQRIHTLSPMKITGPASRSRYLVTRFSPEGNMTRGTVNNCANGHTPWGTYLTCEENFAGYFRRIAAVDNPRRTAKEVAAFARYGVAGTGRELWATVTPDTPDNLFGRWNAEKLGVSAEEAYAELEAVQTKVRRLVSSVEVRERFVYHCPYCGGIESPTCAYMDHPLEWKIEHSLKKPWKEYVTVEKTIETDLRT